MKDLLANMDEWAEHFRQERHGAVLTILRAKTTLTEQAARIQALEDALNQIFHYTDCTTRQTAIIEKVFPELGGRADHTEHDRGHETTPQAHSPQNTPANPRPASDSAQGSEQ